MRTAGTSMLIMLCLSLLLYGCRQDKKQAVNNTVTIKSTAEPQTSSGSAYPQLMRGGTIYGDPCEQLSMQHINRIFKPSVPPVIENQRGDGFNFCSYSWHEDGQYRYEVSLGMGRLKIFSPGKDSILLQNDTKLIWYHDSLYYQLELEPANKTKLGELYSVLRK